MSEQDKPRFVQLAAGKPLSLHDELVLAAGKSMFENAISVTTDYCKTMISISSGAIAIYLGLLKLTVPDKYVYAPNERALAFLPVGAYLLSMIAFVLGYLPVVTRASVSSAKSLAQARANAIVRRGVCGYIGLAFFVLAIATSAWALLMRP